MDKAYSSLQVRKGDEERELQEGEGQEAGKEGGREGRENVRSELTQGKKLTSQRIHKTPQLLHGNSLPVRMSDILHNIVHPALDQPATHTHTHTHTNIT